MGGENSCEDVAYCMCRFGSSASRFMRIGAVFGWPWLQQNNVQSYNATGCEMWESPYTVAYAIASEDV